MICIGRRKTPDKHITPFTQSIFIAIRVLTLFVVKGPIQELLGGLCRQARLNLQHLSRFGHNHMLDRVAHVQRVAFDLCDCRDDGSALQGSSITTQANLRATHQRTCSHPLVKCLHQLRRFQPVSIARSALGKIVNAFKLVFSRHFSSQLKQALISATSSRLLSHNLHSSNNIGGTIATTTIVAGSAHALHLRVKRLKIETFDANDAQRSSIKLRMVKSKSVLPRRRLMAVRHLQHMLNNRIAATACFLTVNHTCHKLLARDRVNIVTSDFATAMLATPKACSRLIFHLIRLTRHLIYGQSRCWSHVDKHASTK
mmetsp:Transcript_73262/g.115939  ORF Transcript_73262/g.115939 Transcript_73262/m.115939 type:complete len:314 (+) Transcript_73262:1481-2422(+)